MSEVMAFVTHIVNGAFHMLVGKERQMNFTKGKGDTNSADQAAPRKVVSHGVSPAAKLRLLQLRTDRTHKISHCTG